MKRSKHPRLRSKTYKGAGGQVWTYYVYDMRGTGKPDVRLGTDYAAALEGWHKLHNNLPLTIGRLQQAFNQWRDQVLPEYENAKTRAEYARHLKNLEGPFGHMGWHEVNLPVLCQYLDTRSAKTQGNRELAVLSIVWGKARRWGMTELPWPAAGVKDWKNPENARSFEVTDALFNAVYEVADQVLRDCMDIASSTGMRITDARTVRMPQDGKLRFRANKTDKWAYFEVAQSPTLTALLERRGKVDCVTLLTTKTGRTVSYSMLRDRFQLAREAAIAQNPELASELRAMILRDMRRRAADLAPDMASASALLQHSSQKVTADHYRTKATKLKAVR
ncbi:integrase [Rhodoferax sp.]|uniref:integrase n=1 Tax=Rhodoferax sp. TaxID=50421 RepID=UPI002ACE80D2|nr:integrase [Rhodoferax sp.]MDZ7918477.1 integrase [Rhodoferax sp.]